MINVAYSFTDAEDAEFAHPEAANHTCLLPPWAGCDGSGEDAASDIIERIIRTEEWENLFGLDEDSGSLLIRIHAPASIAGDYEVSVERVTKARASLRPPP